jgi:hypothetical protein
MGGDPFFWYGSLEPVAIEGCRVEYLDGDVWIDAGLADKIEETKLSPIEVRTPPTLLALQ